MQIFPVHRWAGLPPLRREDATDPFRVLTHRDRHAEIADEGRDDVASPLVAVEITVAAAEADGRTVNRLLTERTEPFALEHRFAVSHLAVGEERLQPIVGGPGDEHATKDFDTRLTETEPASDKRDDFIEKSTAYVDVICEEELLDAGLRHVRTEPKQYEWRYARDDYVDDLTVWATGRFVREMLGENDWAAFMERVRDTFAERFPDPLHDRRDVLLAVGTKG